MAKSILFVDDDQHWRDVVSQALQEAGFTVLTAKDASEAMGHVEGTKIGLMILDLNLAGESGLMLMRYLKHNQPDAPVLLYTGMEHDDASILAMLKQGADQYLRKGSMSELILAVGGYFRQLEGKPAAAQAKKAEPPRGQSSP